MIVTGLRQQEAWAAHVLPPVEQVRPRVWSIPVVYPGFSWDNLRRKPAGTTTIARNGGRFLWEQFDALAAGRALEGAHVVTRRMGLNACEQHGCPALGTRWAGDRA